MLSENSATCTFNKFQFENTVIERETDFKYKQWRLRPIVAKSYGYFPWPAKYIKQKVKKEKKDGQTDQGNYRADVQWS